MSCFCFGKKAEPPGTAQELQQQQQPVQTGLPAAIKENPLFDGGVADSGSGGGGGNAGGTAAAPPPSLQATLLADAKEQYAKSPAPINSTITEMMRVIHEEVGGMDATVAYLAAHNGTLPPDMAAATVETAMEAVGSLVVTTSNLEVQMAESTKQLGRFSTQSLIDEQLAPLKADHARAAAQLDITAHVFSAVWKFTLPAKPAEADGLAGFKQLPLADASGELTQLGVVGWLYLNDQTGTNASGSALAPYAADPDGETVRGIKVSFTGGVTAVVNGSAAAFGATISSFAAARTAVAEPLSLAVLADTDNYQKVYEEATASGGGGGGSPVLVKLGAAVAKAKRATPSKEQVAAVTADPAAPADPRDLGYAMYIRRMAAPTALFLYLLASTLIDSTPEADGAFCIPGPIKGLCRMVAKVIDRYASFAPCRDVARCTVHFPTLDGMAAFLLALVASGLVYIIRVKNRFDLAYDALPAGGYRDLQLLLLLPDGGGTVLDGVEGGKVFRYVELQLNLAAMVAIKNGESELQQAKLAETKKAAKKAAKAGAGAGVEESALSGRAGHDVFNFARAVDAFSVRTLRYKGSPTEQIWQAIAVGALLDVDFEGAKFFTTKEQKQLAKVGSEQCRVRIFG